MPLEKGKSHIGDNIAELKKADPNRPIKQDIAIALHTAHVKPAQAENVNAEGCQMNADYDPNRYAESLNPNIN